MRDSYTTTTQLSKQHLEMLNEVARAHKPRLGTRVMIETLIEEAHAKVRKIVTS